MLDREQRELTQMHNYTISTRRPNVQKSQQHLSTMYQN